MLIASFGNAPHKALETVIARLDSTHLRATIDSARVQVLSDSLHPHIVRVLQEPKGWLESFVSNPAFGLLWPLLTSGIAFLIGRAWQNRDRGLRLKYDQWTSARLTRRYMTSSAKRLRVLIERVTDTQKILAPSHVDFVRRVISDFDEIKARMIVLENDALEERIFNWNAVCLDDLKEMYDRTAMDPDTYTHTYGVQTIQGARDAAIVATISTDADDAEAIARDLEPYTHYRKRPTATPAAPSGEVPPPSV